MSVDEARAVRLARAAVRRATMTVEVVALGQDKLSASAGSIRDERLAAATRLIEHHRALRGTPASLRATLGRMKSSSSVGRLED